MLTQSGSQEEMVINPVNKYSMNQLRPPYILGLDGEMIYHFNAENNVLEIASIQNPRQILDTIPLFIKEGHSFIEFVNAQSAGFLIYETGALSKEARADGDISWSDNMLQIIDLVQKRVKKINSVEPSFKVGRIMHVYHRDPSKFLVRLSLEKSHFVGEICEKFAIYDFNTSESGPDTIILSVLGDQSGGALHLNVDEKPAYILQSRSYTEPEVYETLALFEIREDEGSFVIQTDPIYELTPEQSNTLRIHQIAFNGDLYGSQREEGLAQSNDNPSSWIPVIIRKLESGQYASPEIIDSIEPCEYYSLIQKPDRVIGFVREDISPEVVFNTDLRTAPDFATDPLCERIAIVFEQLKAMQAGYPEDDSPRSREIIDLEFNLGNEPFKHYSGDHFDVNSKTNLIVFSHRKNKPLVVESSIHVVSENSLCEVVRFTPS